MRYPQGRGMVLLKLQPVTTNTNDDRGTTSARGTARMAWELLDMAGSWLVCQWICYQRLGFNSEKMEYVYLIFQYFHSHIMSYNVIYIYIHIIH